MFKLTIEAKSITELHNLIRQASQEINATVGVDFAEPGTDKTVIQEPVEAVAQPKLTDPIPGATYNEAVEAPLGNVDSTGLPWDARIHLSSRKQNKDGSWARKRGLDEAFEAQVIAELRGNATSDVGSFTVPISPVQAPSQPQPIAPMPTTEHRVALPNEPSPLSQLSQPVAPAPLPIINVNGAHSLETFRAQLVHILNGLGPKFQTVEKHQEYINSLKQWFGRDIWDFSNDIQKCEQLFDSMVQQGFVTKAG